MEIDINSQVIQLVKSRPILYTKCHDFQGRAQHWKEIADQLKVEVSWIKGRWHILRAKYLTEHSSELKGRRSNFRYMKELSFLRDHVNVSAFDKLVKPNDDERQLEFVITEQDLQNDSDSDSQSIFVELELEHDLNKEMIQLPQTFNIADEIQEHSIDDAFYMSNEELSQHEPPSKKPKEKSTPTQVYEMIEVRSKDSTIVGETKVNSESRIEEPKEKLKKIENTPDKVSELEPEIKRTEEKPKPEEERVEVRKSDENRQSEKHRCEDTIFGELVTATLRRMDSEKKRAVKREIMNILFT